MKSQAFSMDIMLAVVIFIGTIFVFYSILSGGKETKAGDLEDEASIVLENIASEDSEVRITDGITVNETKLADLLGMEYSDIKKKIKIKNEFCFFLEDEDGNIIYITPEDPAEPDKPGIGSDKIKISGEACA
ncbi:MAG: hypothetical protein IH934_03260 [Nanoarchaeota archaeon]|nr:hypothetical protein [Nanoarchaeota archaeon]